MDQKMMATKSRSSKRSHSSKSKKNASTNKSGGTRKKSKRKWSGKVNATSDAMDLEQNIFKSKSPKRIASSVKGSAEKSKRRKGSPLQSAMSMLNFYENRAGKNLSAARKNTLDKAKNELRKLFGRAEKNAESSTK